MPEVVDLAIVGGGAAGLAAAIFAGQTAASLSRTKPARIIVLDGAKTLGAKILVAGGGRCNVTHHAVVAEDFNGSRNVVRNVLAAFDAPAAVRWFASMGVELKREETGKLFPVTDSARTVLAALLKRCGEAGVMIRGGCRVNEISAPNVGDQIQGQQPDQNRYFRIIHEGDGGEILARRIILATGGRSLPLTGSDGSGWELARRLGHSVTPTFAALAPLVLEAGMFHAQLSGIAMEVELSTFGGGGRLIDRRAGSLLWTHFGISGPVVMDASRHWVIAKETSEARMVCNLLHPDGFEQVDRWLIDLGTSRARTSIVNAMAGRLPERVAAAAVIHAGIDPAIPCGQLSRDARGRWCMRWWRWNCRWRGIGDGIMPRRPPGGVPLNEIDYRTMESRKMPGLYLAGEMLDCDGRIGGFNFQWAWATGFLAGNAAGADR